MGDWLARADVNLYSVLVEANCKAGDLADNRTTVIGGNGHVSASVFGTNSDRLAGSVDSNGLRTSFIYDLGGHQTVMQNPRGFRWTSSFDAVGRLATLANPFRFIQTYQYDPEFRLNQVLYPDGTHSVYKFDSFTGLRRTKLEPSGVLTSFIWDGDDSLQERS